MNFKLDKGKGIPQWKLLAMRSALCQGDESYPWKKQSKTMTCKQHQTKLFLDWHHFYCVCGLSYVAITMQSDSISCFDRFLEMITRESDYLEKM